MTARRSWLSLPQTAFRKLVKRVSQDRIARSRHLEGVPILAPMYDRSPAPPYREIARQLNVRLGSRSTRSGARNLRIKKAVITAAGPSQRALPLQTVIDRDGREKSVLAIFVEQALAANIQEICV